MKSINWDEVTANEAFENLPAGGYICGIRSVEDYPGKEFLKFEFDIASGEFKNYYRGIYDRTGKWLASYVKSYKDKALGFFKAMLEAFAASNDGFVINSNDEKRMKKKFIGLVLAYEEYEGNDKEGRPKIKQRVYVSDIKSVQDIKDGNYDVPALKKLEGSAAASPAKSTMNAVVEEDVPW